MKVPEGTFIWLGSRGLRNKSLGNGSVEAHNRKCKNKIEIRFKSEKYENKIRKLQFFLYIIQLLL